MYCQLAFYCETKEFMPFNLYLYLGIPRWLSGKESACQCRRHRRRKFGHWVRKMPGGGNGSPLQYSCWKDPMDREAWWATAHEVTKESDKTE